MPFCMYYVGLCHRLLSLCLSVIHPQVTFAPEKNQSSMLSLFSRCHISLYYHILEFPVQHGGLLMKKIFKLLVFSLIHLHL